MRTTTANIILVSLILVLVGQSNAETLTWRGLTVEPENRCEPYVRSHYHYSASIEQKIVDKQDGKIWSPYDNKTFKSIKETDIEHIVAAAEAHDSGLCSADRETRKTFAQDLRNLTLAGPWLNRYDKVDKDAADWLPTHNKCWYVQTILEVKRAYVLSVDQAEADAIEAVLEGCEEKQ